MTVELPYDIGTKVYYVCSWGVESGVIDYYEILKEIIFAYDKEGCLLSNIQNLYSNYDVAYKEWEKRYINKENSNEE